MGLPVLARDLDVELDCRYDAYLYRVVYEVHDGKLLVFGVRVGHRREVYARRG